MTLWISSQYHLCGCSGLHHTWTRASLHSALWNEDDRWRPRRQLVAV